MNKIKWLLEIADRKPLLFSIALLLITVVVLAAVVKDRDKRIDSCLEGQRAIQNYYENRLEQKDSFYKQREIELQLEVKTTLQSIIDDYKSQLEVQKTLRNKVTTTLYNNEKIINDNNLKIKNLQNEK